MFILVSGLLLVEFVRMYFDRPLPLPAKIEHQHPLSRFRSGEGIEKKEWLPDDSYHSTDVV